MGVWGIVIPNGGMLMDEASKRRGTEVMRLWDRLRAIRDASGWERKMLACSYFHHRDSYAGTLVPYRETYDASPVSFLDTFLSGFVGYMMPQDDQWADLVPLRVQAAEGSGSKRKEFADLRALDAEPGLLKWCGSAVQAVLAAYASTDYYPEARMAAKDWLVTGTGYLMACESQSGMGVYYRCFDPQEVCIAEDAERRVNVFVRRFLMDARDVVRAYPEKEWPALRQRIRSGAGEAADVACYEAIVPTGYLEGGTASGGGWEHLLYVADEGELAFESSFDSFPVACVRRSRDNSRSPYGIGLCEEALALTVQLDDMGKVRQVMRQKNANPPMVLPYSLRNAFSSRPGARNYVPDMAQRPMPVQDQYSASEMLADIQDAREQLRAVMGADLFRAVMSSTDSRKTAYEVSERKNEAMTLLQMQVGTFRMELVEPVFKRTLEILHRQGLVPWRATRRNRWEPAEPFASFLASSRVELNSVFVRRVEAFMQYQQSLQALQILTTVQQVFPQAVLNVEENSFTRGLLYGAGIPKSQMKELADTEKAQRAFAEQQARQAQMQMAREQSAAMKDLAGAGIPMGGAL